MYSSIIININGLNIMVTLISVYFEYIKILYKIFTKYIVPILQVYQNQIKDGWLGGEEQGFVTHFQVPC